MNATTNSIDNLEERLRAQLEVLKQNPDYQDEHGNLSGYVSGEDTTNSGALRLSFTRFGGKNNRTEIRLPLGMAEPDDEQKKRIREIAERVLKDSGLYLRDKSIFVHTPETIQLEAKALARQMMASDPEFKEGQATQKGIFALTIDNNRGEQGTPCLYFWFRPYVHIERSKHQYVKDSHVVHFSTGNMQRQDNLLLMNHAREALIDMGFQDTPLPRNRNSNRSVPKDWVNISSLVVKPSGHNYLITVVPKTPSKRLPEIRISSGLSDEAKAIEAKDALCKDYLAPRLKKGNKDDITVDSMAKWLAVWRKQKGYDQQVLHEAPERSYIVDIGSEREQKCRFFTPNTVPTRTGTSVNVRFAPFVYGNPPLSDKLTTMTFAINVNEKTGKDEEETKKLKELVTLRKNIVNEISIAALEQYFLENPHAQFDTEEIIAKRDKGRESVIVHAIKSLPDPSYALGATIDELQLAIESGSAPPHGSLSAALFFSLNARQFNEVPSREELISATRDALDMVLGKPVDNESLLGRAMSDGLHQFMDDHPHYRIRVNLDESAGGVEVNRAMYMDATYVREEILRPTIKQVFDFQRMIVWDSLVKQDEEKGDYVITLNALRNPFSDSPEPAAPPWDKPVQLRVDNEDKAYEFIKAINRHFYADMLEGIFRPVEDFESPSQGSVFRKSLQAGFAVSGINIPEQSPYKVTLEQMQRRAQVIWSRGESPS